MKKLSFHFLPALLLLSVFSSCQLFENDVEDFMEKYTETAAIEVHEINVNTYEDALEQLCIASEEDAEINFYMRNPKQFMMVPSVSFINLSSKVSRSSVNIEQITTEIVNLKLPQDFLIPADEGQDITLEINLYEPMSGREFDIYTVPLHCNTEPPPLLNPTILNKNDQKFVVAFDMPNEEDVAIRHKDLSEVVINGNSYPVKVSTEPSTEIEGVKVAVYTFSDSHFKRSERGAPYSRLNQKDYTENRNSVYFETDDAFVAGDKEYTIVLKDKAGLSSTVTASTSISKLVKPLIMDQNGSIIAEGGLTGIPFNEDTKVGKVTIIPPTEDHHGQPVSGTTVHYKIYEATGTGRIYTSGTTTESKTIELPQNTYRVEAYATLSNYENSATTTVKFRFLNNVLFVEEGAYGDGSEIAPFGSVSEALTSINDPDRKRQSKYTIYLDGDFDEDVEIHTDLNTDEIILAKNPRGTRGTASVKAIKFDNYMPSTFKLGVNGLTINNPASYGLYVGRYSDVTISFTDVTITSSGGSQAIKIDEDSEAKLTFTNVNISGFTHAVLLNKADLTFNSGTITGESGGSALSYFGIKATYGKLIFNGGTVTGYTNGIGIFAASDQVEINGGNITNNERGIDFYGGSLIVSGGKIENNKTGIYVEGDGFKVKDKPLIQNNKTNDATPVKQNVVLTAGTNIGFAGALKSGAKIGVTTDSDRQPAALGEKFIFATGYTYSDSPSKYFVSDQGFSIAKNGTNLEVAKSGSNGGSYNADSYIFKLAASSNWAPDNQDKDITITLAPSRIKADGNEEALMYSTEDKELYLGGAKLNEGEKVSWSIKVMSGSHEAASSDTDTITISELPPFNYKIQVVATYLGLPHDAEFDLEVRSVEVDADGATFPGTAAMSSPVFKENRSITIRPLIAMDHEVTQGEYSRFMTWYPSYEPGDVIGVGQDYPAYCVNWYEAVMYCNLLSKAEGLEPVYYLADSSGNPVTNGYEVSTWKNRINKIDCTTEGKYYYNDTNSGTYNNELDWYDEGSGDSDGGIRMNPDANGWRLPTEIEWEYLARGGNLTSDIQWSGTNTLGEVTEYAWYSANSGDNGGSNNKKPHEVMGKKPNALGLYDMSGNVMEWCWDWFGTVNSNTEETGPSYGEEHRHVARGGAYLSEIVNVKTNYRYQNGVYYRLTAIGFRVVRNKE